MTEMDTVTEDQNPPMRYFSFKVDIPGNSVQAWVDEMHLGYKEPQLSNERTGKPAVTCKRTGDGGVSYTADKTRAFDWTLDLSEWKYIRNDTFTRALYEGRTVVTDVNPENIITRIELESKLQLRTPGTGWESCTLHCWATPSSDDVLSVKILVEADSGCEGLTICQGTTLHAMYCMQKRWAERIYNETTSWGLKTSSEMRYHHGLVDANPSMLAPEPSFEDYCKGCDSMWALYGAALGPAHWVGCQPCRGGAEDIFGRQRATCMHHDKSLRRWRAYEAACKHPGVRLDPLSERPWLTAHDPPAPCKPVASSMPSAHQGEAGRCAASLSAKASKEHACMMEGSCAQSSTSPPGCDRINVTEVPSKAVSAIAPGIGNFNGALKGNEQHGKKVSFLNTVKVFDIHDNPVFAALKDIEQNPKNNSVVSMLKMTEQPGGKKSVYVRNEKGMRDNNKKQSLGKHEAGVGASGAAVSHVALLVRGEKAGSGSLASSSTGTVPLAVAVADATRRRLDGKTPVAIRCSSVVRAGTMTGGRPGAVPLAMAATDGKALGGSFVLQSTILELAGRPPAPAAAAMKPKKSRFLRRLASRLVPSQFRRAGPSASRQHI